MMIPEFRAAIEAKAESSDLATWLMLHLLADQALRKAFKRWGCTADELAGFIWGRNDLTLPVLSRILKDTHLDAGKLVFQYSMAALAGGGPKLDTKAEPTPYDERPIVNVDVAFYTGAGQYYKPEDFTRDGLWLRATANDANTFGDWTMVRRTGNSLRIPTGVRLTHGPDVLRCFEQAESIAHRDFACEPYETHAMLRIRIVALRAGEGRPDFRIRPGERVGFLRIGSSALTVINTGKGRGMPNHEQWAMPVDLREKKEPAPTKESGLWVCGCGDSVCTPSHCANELS